MKNLFPIATLLSPGIRALSQCGGARGPAPLLIIDTQPIVLLNGWVESLVLEEELFDVSATVDDPRWYSLSFFCSGGTQINRMATLVSIASYPLPGDPVFIPECRRCVTDL